mmetsp:Transcript_20723/g.67043  ORF Transcript_20723/g.67043 Transcript_20723/m.67043 type:complete len:107 (+) Transcript_20723:159-479(+)
MQREGAEAEALLPANQKRAERPMDENQSSRKTMVEAGSSLGRWLSSDEGKSPLLQPCSSATALGTVRSPPRCRAAAPTAAALPPPPPPALHVQGHPLRASHAHSAL